MHAVVFRSVGGDSEVFCTAGVTPICAEVGDWGPPKKWKFKQILRYKCPTPSHPLYNFHEIFRDCRDISAGLYKNSGKFDRGVTELWVLICGVLQIFSTPGGKTKHQAPTVLEVFERARGPLSPYQIWWGSDFARHRGAKNVDFFCLSVCPSCSWTA